jgi:hypothetical protein
MLIDLIDLIVRLLAGIGGPVAAIKVADECLRYTALYNDSMRDLQHK